MESTYKRHSVLQHKHTLNIHLKVFCPVFSVQKGCTSAIVCTWALSDSGNRQATQEQPTQTTTGLCSQSLATQKGSAPGMPVLIPQLGSNGVMSHILGAGANFFLLWGICTIWYFHQQPVKGRAGPLSNCQNSTNSKTLSFLFFLCFPLCSCV